jgi:non-ribosomal peptide synthetase component F
MRRLGELKPGAYPHLRLSLFCGEALPLEVVRDWSTAAPNSRIENIYGPTELTIGCTAYRWDNVTSPPYCEHGIVPIGEPFEDMEALIVDEELREVEAGEEGELIMTGPQLSQGYWRDEEKKDAALYPCRIGKVSTIAQEIAFVAPHLINLWPIWAVLIIR